MKALCLKEPWASMIKEGKKTIETRKWKTNYRGNIILCASKYPKSELSGKAFAIAELIDVRKMTEHDEDAACCKIYPRANSWILKDIKNIKPFTVKGKLGLFEINENGIQ
ncbi:ASCH domain-containing protein [Candidatus Pacearchaeota archaeon]|nr:ASCH domain-containing protein [Candidatus Pacearchaeota archaeon]